MKQPERKLPVADNGKPAVSAELSRQKPAMTLAAIAEDAILKAPISALDSGRLRGRPATGKRSNPDWKLYSHFLKKNTQRAAVVKLQADNDGRDLSDVLQELLEGWLKA